MNDGLRILVIDDNEIDRELVCRLIGRGYQLEVVATAKDGVAAISANRPHLVLLDYHLPDARAFELLESLVAADLPVIVLTGENSPEVIVSAMQKGARDFLLKERLTKESLSLAVRSALSETASVTDSPKRETPAGPFSQDGQERDRRLHPLATVLTLAEQRERRRVARLVHDHLQQLLYAVQMQLHLVEQDLPPDAPQAVRESAAEAEALILEAIEAARTLSVELRPPVNRSEGVRNALGWLGRHMERVHGLRVDLTVESDFVIANEDLHDLVLQSVQELLFNVVKHANVEAAKVRVVTQDGHKRISVEDEGVGFERDKVVRPEWQPEQGYGLYSVRERLGLFGGRLEIDAHPNNGARVTIVLPDAILSGAAH